MRVVEQLTAEVVGALSRRISEGRTFHIEDIQDQVELALMRSEHHKVARAYVLYREERDPAARRAGSRRIGQAVAADPSLQVTLANGAQVPLDTARLDADRQRGLRRSRRRRGRAGARRNPAQSL